MFARRVLLRRVEVEVLAAARRVRAGDLRVRARAGELRLLEDLAVARRRSPSATQSSEPSRSTARALRAEDPRLLVEALAADEAQAARSAPTTSSTTVLNRPSASRRRELLLPDLGLGALLEHDRARASSARCPAAAWTAVSSDRRLERARRAGRRRTRRPPTRPRCARRTGRRRVDDRAEVRARRARGAARRACDSGMTSGAFGRRPSTGAASASSTWRRAASAARSASNTAPRRGERVEVERRRSA